MKIDNQVKYDFCDLLLRPKRSDLSSRSEVSLEKEFTFKYSRRTWTGVPIIASNMDTVGTFEMYDALSKLKCIVAFHKFYSIEDYESKKDTLDPNYYSLTTGIRDEDWRKTKAIINLLNPYFLTIDVANGYSTKLVEFCKMVREEYPQLTIIAGNVATGDMVQELILYAKVDIVKCGIGSGALCITRTKTGVGVPQLSVCDECSESANGLDGHIVSDGGCVLPGDISKAFCAGAHFVMLGGMLGGHDESGGEIIEEEGVKYKMIYGMSSKLAQDKHLGGMKSYRSSEGKVRKVKYRGPVSETLMDILGGMRSTGTYIGARRLKDFPKCATFVKVNRILNNSLDSKNNSV
tara:strand:+ start:567 stop:1613 length:1047 start_codon:yes stop_codon:yes gene_type:complete